MIACVALVALCAAASVVVLSTGPLREVGHGPATQTVCGNVVVHANAAIAATVRGDAAIGHAVALLRSLDLDEADSGRRNGLSELARFVSDANENAASGTAEVRRLSEIGERAQAPQREELRAFTGPLAKALDLQRKMGADLANFVLEFERYEIRQAPRDPGAADATREPLGASGRALVRPIVPGAFGQPHSLTVEPRNALAATARTTANDLDNRTSTVSAQEARAAEHAEAAVRGCS